MGDATLFDDLDNGSVSVGRKPFFAIEYTSEDRLLEWLNAEVHYLKDQYQDWHEEIKNNYKRFKEIQYREQVLADRNLPEKRTRFTPNVVAPLIRDITDERIARMMEFKPNVVVLPQHDEQQDKVDAKIAKKFVSHVDKAERVDYKLQRFLRTCYVAGESYLVPLWNPDKGFLHPDAKSAGKMIFVGDIDVRHFSPLKVMLQKKNDDSERDYGFLFEVEYEDVLKKQYPSKADKIKGSAVSFYDAEKMEDVTEGGMVSKVTFWHRKTPYLPDGFECVFTNDCVFKATGLPYQHGKLPIIVLTDNENLEEGHGRSFIGSIKGMVTYFNNMLNMGLKQMSLLSWPKWFVDAGSVDDQQLNNDVGIVKVNPGANRPMLSQGSPMSPQLMEFKNKALEWIYSWGKSNSVIRGEPPSGVTAFVALQYVSESENRRMNISVVKFNEAVRLMYEMILLTCGQYYKKEDKRTLLVVGKDNSWSAESYDPASLAKEYSIVIQNASALPDSKAAKTQYILDLAKNFPDLFPREQLLEMLDLGQSDKFIDEASSAARAAEAENEMIMEGIMPKAPAEHEFLITHWKVHLRSIQDINFKEKATDIVKKMFRDHIMATEYLMMKQALKSPTFAQELMTLSQFPIYWEEGVQALMPPPMAAPPATDMQAGMTEGMPTDQAAPQSLAEAQV